MITKNPRNKTAIINIVLNLLFIFYILKFWPAFSLASSEYVPKHSLVSITHIFSSDESIEVYLRNKLENNLGNRVDLLIYFIEYYSFKCKNVEIGDFEIWCDLVQPVRVREGEKLFWFTIRRGILINNSGEDVNISVQSYLSR